jgi:hypothetical protein
MIFAGKITNLSGPQSGCDANPFFQNQPTVVFVFLETDFERACATE